MKRILPVITMIFALAGLAALTLMQLAKAAETADPPPAEAAPATAQAGDARSLLYPQALRGYVTVAGRTYYYDADGVMGRGGIVGSEEEGYTYADENGVCCMSEEIRLAADFMMKHGTGETLDERMKTGFLYLANHFGYLRSFDHTFKAQDMAGLAVDMFTNEKGNCYRYAACFACIAKIAGYRARVGIGTTVGNPHGWTEVKVGSRWLICDPDAEMAEKAMPDYYSYMMERHFWQITARQRIELTIDRDGCAVWK